MVLHVCVCVIHRGYQCNGPGMGGAVAAMVLPVSAVQLGQGTKETSPKLGRKLKIQIAEHVLAI